VGPGWSLQALRSVWARVHLLAPLASEHSWQWPAIAAAVLAVGASASFLHFLLGLWAVARCRRRSQGIDDAALKAMVEQLQTQVPRAVVEVRESPDLNTPAALGWRRPLVLLPLGWRTWSNEELRSVLAHELAHVSAAII
jgi:beta-lactamase regulating signal transducer with metallopeptidase domain